MAALLRRLPGFTASSSRCLVAIIRAKPDNSPGLIPRDRGALQAAERLPVAACSHTQSRWLHAEAPLPVEVDLKRLDGEDQGRNTEIKPFPMHLHRNSCINTQTMIVNEGVPQIELLAYGAN